MVGFDFQTFTEERISWKFDDSNGELKLNLIERGELSKQSYKFLNYVLSNLFVKNKYGV